VTVRVVIVDDQPPYRDAAKLVFDILDDFEVVGEATSGEEALAVVESLTPDLVMMDINLPGMNGVEATRRLLAAHPSVVAVLVSTYEADDLPADAASSGALAYVHKEHLDGDLIEELWRERSLTMWRTA
jgi:two-component system, NarL family, invasion response regulator UvrY